MTYLDPKEDVFDFELTPHGKFLFSQGKFKPTFYSFSDEDVNYTLITEQNKVNDRVLEETVYTRINPRNRQTLDNVSVSYVANSYSPSTVSGREPGLFGASGTENVPEKSVSEMDLDNIIVKTLTINKSLGNISLGSQKGPKLKISVLDGKIVNASNFLSLTPTTILASDNEKYEVAIPQIDMDINYKSSVIDSRLEVREKIIKIDDTISGNGIRSFLDGGQIVVETDQIVLMIEEENTYDLYDNFDIEVFEISDSDNEQLNDNVLRKLKFSLDPLFDTNIKDNFFLEKPSFQPNTSQTAEQVITTYGNVREAGYYLSVLTDSYEEISDEMICSLIKELKSNDIALDIPYECPDEVPVEVEQSYLYQQDKTVVDNC